MARIRVENHTNLVRDTDSNAIVNVSQSEYQLYMKRVKARDSQSDELRGAIREINNLKQDFFEIKKLLKRYLKNNGCKTNNSNANFRRI